MILNTNADTIASRLAIEFSNFFKVLLFYCFEKEGCWPIRSMKTAFWENFRRPNVSLIRNRASSAAA